MSYSYFLLCLQMSYTLPHEIGLLNFRGKPFLSKRICYHEASFKSNAFCCRMMFGNEIVVFLNGLRFNKEKLDISELGQSTDI